MNLRNVLQIWKICFYFASTKHLLTIGGTLWKGMMKRLLYVVTMTILCCLSASAQRTMNGQSSLCLQAAYTGFSFGAEAFFSRYSPIGFWEAGIGAKQYTSPTSADIGINSLHAMIEGGYLFRIAGTRCHSVNLYGGAGAFLGYEAVDPKRRLPSSLQTNLKDCYFLYGLHAKLVAEFFISKAVAFTLNGCAPINFSSPLGKIHYDAGVGMKVML